jgi:Neurotransmitter-gated ion-channel ligand binding domain
VDLYLRQQWLDSRLQYDIDSREEINDVPLPKGREVWKPDTFFIGAEEMASGDELRSRVVVEPSGFVRSSEKRSIMVRAENSGTYPLSNRRSFQLKLSSCE